MRSRHPTGKNSSKTRQLSSGARWLTAAALSLALTGCAADQADSAPDEPAAAKEDDLPVQTKLAELIVRGTTVEFVQTSPDNVLVLAGSATSDNPLGDPDVEGLSAVELYEHFAHAPAPAALTAVPAASLPVATAGTAEGAAPDHDKHTNQEFRDAYCTDWRMTCVTDVWGQDTDVDKRATWMAGLVEPINGDGIALRVREDRPVRGWHTILYRSMQVGEHWRWRATAGGLYARRMQALIEGVTTDVSAGSAFCNGNWFSAGYCRSDRYHWMFHSGVD